MPGKTAKVTITERQHDILRTIQNAPTASSQLRQRAAIILLAFDRQGNPQIAAQVGLSRRQVSLRPPDLQQSSLRGLRLIHQRG